MTTETATPMRQPTLRLLGRILDAHSQPFQSNFQNDRFVLVMEGVTLYGAFRQAVREVSSRIDAIRSEYIDINQAVTDAAMSAKRTAGDVNQKRRDKAGAQKRRQKAEAHFEAARDAMKKQGLEIRMVDREREFAHWVNRLMQLHEALMLAHPDGPDFEALEREYWREKFIRSALGEKAVMGQVSKGTLDCILSLPAEDLATALEAVPYELNPKQAMEKLIARPSIDIDALPPVEDLALLEGHSVKAFVTLGSPEAAIEDDEES
jgi:hypothetical protein